MTASVEWTGLAAFAQNLKRVAGGELQAAMTANIQEARPQIVADIRGSTFTKIQRRAAATVISAPIPQGIEIAGGAGQSLGAVLFDGAEYGGRKSKRVTYATRSRQGRAYVVRRRTTMQFLPHLGREGYFYWPTIREWIPRLAERQDAIVKKALG